MILNESIHGQNLSSKFSVTHQSKKNGTLLVYYVYSFEREMPDNSEDNLEKLFELLKNYVL